MVRTLLALQNVILEMIARGAGFEATVDHLCEQVEEALPDIVCAILLADENGLVRTAFASRFPNDCLEALRGHDVTGAMRVRGSAAPSKGPVKATDIQNTPPWTGLYSQSMRACWSVPIIGAAANIVGDVLLFCRERRDPTEAERAVLETCAHLCAIAFDRHGRVLEREHRASVDAMTQLANRSAFDQALAQLPCDKPGLWGVLLLDLDNLKVVNDTFGHGAGDCLLQAVASRMTVAAAPDKVFRIGGDEFAVIVQSAEALRDLDGFASGILGGLGDPVPCRGHIISPKATIGGAVLMPEDRVAETVRQNADYALYHAKETGRGGFVRYWPGLDSRITHRLAAIRDLHAALTDNRIEAHYQPIVHLGTRRIVAMKALARMRAGSGKLLPAEHFHEAISDAQLASTLTERILTLVADDMRSWLDLGIPIDYVSINITQADLYGGKLKQQLAASFERRGVALDRLSIEISETISVNRHHRLIPNRVATLRKSGLRIVLADFGAGSASLTQLLAEPIDALKVDKAVIKGLGRDERATAMLEGLLLFAGKLDIAVIAGGVETEDQASLLTQLGCVYGQGFLFAKPLNRAMATLLLQDQAEMQSGPGSSFSRNIRARP